MKITIVLLACFGLAFGASVPQVQPRSTLSEDFDSILVLVPTDQIIEIVLDYVLTDQQVGEGLAFILGEEFAALVQEVNELKEYIAFLDYLQNQGVDVYAVVNFINELLGLPLLTPPSHVRKTQSRIGEPGFRGLIDEILAITPVDDIRAQIRYLSETSPDFQKLIEEIKSEDFQVIVSTISGHPSYQKLIEELRLHGIDVDLIINFLRTLFGW